MSIRKPMLLGEVSLSLLAEINKNHILILKVVGVEAPQTIAPQHLVRLPTEHAVLPVTLPQVEAHRQGQVQMVSVGLVSELVTRMSAAHSLASVAKRKVRCTYMFMESC